MVLLDVALGPGPNGYEVCRTLRERRNVVPIIMLTALDTEADAVQGLEAGADDYVTKPFGLAELRSRVRAVLRRSGPRTAAASCSASAGVTLDRGQREVTVGERLVRLTFSEFELLARLMSEPGRLFNRQELLRAIWGDSAYRDPRAIDVHIRHLREKLEAAPGGAPTDRHRARRRLPLPGVMMRPAPATAGGAAAHQRGHARGRRARAALAARAAAARGRRSDGRDRDQRGARRVQRDPEVDPATGEPIRGRTGSRREHAAPPLAGDGDAPRQPARRASTPDRAREPQRARLLRPGAPRAARRASASTRWSATSSSWPTRSKSRAGATCSW